MVPILPDSDQRHPWQLIIHGDEAAPVGRALEHFRDAFEDCLRRSKDGTWLLEIEDFISQIKLKDKAEG
jgi:hypothetical protein